MKTAQWSYEVFKRQFRSRTGLDLESYKDAQMERRIRQFMERHGQACFSTFFSLLQENPDRMNEFQGYLTINTSSFFRDRAVFDYLEETVIPDLLRKHRRVKIWSAPCSTGEEPYSIAIILDRLGCLGRSNILASDIDVKALAKARAGSYLEHSLGNLPKDIIQDYFTRNQHTYTISPRIRSAVRFDACDLLRETEPGNHLILCRNFLIYLKRSAQEEIISRFVDNLEPGGALVVGSAENIGGYRQWGLKRVTHSVYLRSE